MFDLGKILICFITLSSLVYAQKTIVVETNHPACFKLTNTATLTAIVKANDEVDQLCTYPMLEDIEVNILKGSGCSYVDVVTTYTCP